MSSGDSDADIWRTIGHDLTQTFVAVVVKTFVIGVSLLPQILCMHILK